MDRNFLQKAAIAIQEKEKIFKNRSLLDPSAGVQEIVGREKQAEELVRYIIAYKKNYIVPFLSIFGRSGSGKSTLVKFVCETFRDEIAFCFVNLRSVKTIFGSVNLILGELGVDGIKSAQGINAALEKIEQAIETTVEKKKLFLLVLDEFDMLFLDKRTQPSDFIYKLALLQENLKKKNFLTCIITISNNVLADHNIADKVRSRIGSSEIFFEPYTKDDIIKILSHRVSDSLVEESIDESTLEYCAEQSSLGHGDARRAIDLLRVSAELVADEGERKILQKHVDAAMDKLQKERVTTALAAASYHQRVICFCMARLTYILEKDWHSTSVIFSQYQKFIPDKVRPLAYRRVSELLIDLENTGIVKYNTSSHGRYGRDTQFTLTELPETVGAICFPDAWKNVVTRKREYEEEMEKIATPGMLHDPKSVASKMLAKMKQEEWKEFVGVDK